MMSTFDIFYSINKALMFLTYPSGLGVPTFGTVGTCTLQGFFTQFGYAAGSYNLVLSLYYFLIINKGMKKEEFAKCWEKWLHGIVVVCHVSFATIGASIGLFNPTAGFCYITPGPYGCNTDPDVACRFQYTAAYFYEAFAQGWIQVAYVVIIVTNLLIWMYVRRQEKDMEKYRTRLTNEEMAERQQKSSYARNVFIQSILYVGAFILCWSWATVYHLVAWTTGASVPWITLLINTFLPLQGFFNAFIYARPRYIRLKKRYGHLSTMQLIKLVFLPEEEGRRGRTTVGDQSTFGSGGARKTTSSSVAETGGREVSESDVAIDNSGVFKSFLKSMNKHGSKRKSGPPSVPVVFEGEWDKPNENEDTKLTSVDEEKGRSEEGEEKRKGEDWTENNPSPAVNVEEEKNEE